MTEEPKGKFETCLRIMEEIEAGKERVGTNVFTIAEIFHILTSRERMKPSEARDKLSALLDCAGLKLMDVHAEMCASSLALAIEHGVDFVDAYNALTMRKYRINEIYSLDSHYNKILGMKRLDRI
jgi:predicted nucleic acid-binding protein